MTTLSRIWKIELTFDELTAIECALAHVSEAEVAAGLGRPPGDVGAVVSGLRHKTASMIAWGRHAQGQPAIVLDEASHAVEIFGDRFGFKPISFRLLSHLIRRQGSWVRSESLQRDVLQTSVHDGASNIRWHVLQARRALARQGGLLHSDNRLGFMFDLAACDRPHCASRGRPPNESSVVR